MARDPARAPDRRPAGRPRRPRGRGDPAAEPAAPAEAGSAGPRPRGDHHGRQPALGAGPRRRRARRPRRRRREDPLAGRARDAARRRRTSPCTPSAARTGRAPTTRWSASSACSSRRSAPRRRSSSARASVSGCSAAWTSCRPSLRDSILEALAATDGGTRLTLAWPSTTPAGPSSWTPCGPSWPTGSPPAEIDEEAIAKRLYTAGHAGPGPRDPDRWRAAALELPDLAECVRRVLVLRRPLAGLRRGGLRRRARRIRPPVAAVRNAKAGPHVRERTRSALVMVPVVVVAIAARRRGDRDPGPRPCRPRRASRSSGSCRRRGGRSSARGVVGGALVLVAGGRSSRDPRQPARGRACRGPRTSPPAWRRSNGSPSSASSPWPSAMLAFARRDPADGLRGLVGDRLRGGLRRASWAPSRP